MVVKFIGLLLRPETREAEMSTHTFGDLMNADTFQVEMSSSSKKEVFKRKLEAAVNKALKTHFLEINKPTAHHREAWQGIFQGKDLLVILPTGSGKSRIYQAAPTIATELRKQGFLSAEGKSIILVVTLLVAS